MENPQPEILRLTYYLLKIPHNGKFIYFNYPAFGSNTYQSVGKEILENKFQVPTGDETASLLHSAYCSDLTNKPEFQNVKQIMKSNWLWVYNQNLWTDKGVYVVKDLKALGKSQPLNIKDLEKILKNGKEIKGIRFSEDNLVRFAPKGSYAIDTQVSPEQFSENGFIIASCGKQGAEKLAEVSTKFRNQPYIYGLNIKEGNSPEQRISAVSEGDDGLGFGGSYWYDYSRGHAFAIKK